MRRFLCLTLCAFTGGGCATYAPQPLDTGASLTAWRERTPTLSLVRDFAQSQRAATTNPNEFNAEDGIDFAEAETLTLLFNPQLRHARLEADITRLGAVEAGRWEDPRFGIDAERILSGANDPWVLGGLIDLTIPLSGRLAVEQHLASAEADVAKLRVVEKERQVIADLRKTWADYSALQLRRNAIDQAISDLTTIESSVGKLRDAGELDPTDARLFAIDLTRRRSQKISNDREMKRTEATLRQLMGLAPQVSLKLVAEFPADIAVSGAIDIENNPRIAAAHAAYQVAEKTFELEVRKQYPDIEIGGGFGSDEGDSRLLGGFSLPIPIFNGNRRAIVEARANRESAAAAYEAELIAVTSELDSWTNDATAALEEVHVIEKDLIPLVDRQLFEARRLLEVGEFNPLLVRDAIDDALSTKLELIDARLSLTRANIEKLHLTENPFAAPAGPATEPTR